MSANDTWPRVYSQFLDARTRPARDLLSRIPSTRDPKIIYDLGCGPGNSTVLLHERWKNARVTGIDSSPHMVEQAKNDYPFLHFEEQSIENFSLRIKPDIIFANASLQWVNNHETLIPKLLNMLKLRGILAIQIPNNFHGPSHQVTVQLLKKNPTWEPLLKKLRYGELDKPYYAVEDYYNLLIKSGVQQLELWESVYYPDMRSYEDIFDWVRGTGLRPVFTALNETDQKLFKEAYLKEIASHYKTLADGKILFPFRRLFIVCARGE